MYTYYPSRTRCVQYIFICCHVCRCRCRCNTTCMIYVHIILAHIQQHTYIRTHTNTLMHKLVEIGRLLISVLTLRLILIVIELDRPHQLLLHKLCCTYTHIVQQPIWYAYICVLCIGKELWGIVGL